MSGQDIDELTALRAVSQSNLNFTTAIYKVLAKNEGNLFFSPVSIEVILALAYMGAGGQTAQQMVQGLCLPADKETSRAGFHALMTSLTSGEGVTLDIANKVYVDTSVNVKDEFLSVAQDIFKSDVENVDFMWETEAARDAINRWVESKTNNKIQDLLAEGVLNKDTVMALVNAVYFKGDWATQFDPALTSTQPFHVNTSHYKDVEMMHLTDSFEVGVRDDLDRAMILRLPYAGGKASMLIMLPRTVDGLAALEAKLPEVSLVEVMGRLFKTEARVQLPKFKLEEYIDLKEVLQQLGVVEMFENTANFSGLIEDGPPVKVSKVIHKAVIEVNEEGSEAAAASSVVFMAKSLPFQCIADHPFVFFLVDTNTASVLFAGRYAAPN